MANLDPGNFDLDIYAQDIRGLGKGKGFATTNRGSILHSAEVRSKIAPRLLDLVQLLVNEGIVSREAVREIAGLPEEESVEAEADEKQAIRENEEERESQILDIINGLAEALGDDPDSYEAEGESDELIEKLRYFADRIKDEYSALKEGGEAQDNE